MEVIEEKAMSKPKKIKKELSFKKEKYYISKEVEREYVDEKGKRRFKIDVVDMIRDEYNTHLHKCRIRACQALNVDLDHLKTSYGLLLGKKIDRFFIQDLIDRYGFSDGSQLSRADLASNAGYKNKLATEIATEKLKNVLANEDVIKAYDTLLKDGVVDLLKGFKEDVTGVN